jgi:mono/diheme cytochrome c family protein
VHRTPEVPLDIEAINENARKEGASSCQVCHGGNGT